MAVVVSGGGSEPVGRVPERERIAAALATAVAGPPVVVAVDGEPGIGKTSLVLWEVARGPWRTVVVSGDEAEIDLEWGVVDQILRVDPMAAPADGRADAAGTGAVLAAALGRLAADRPLAVVVDDAHWADLASLRALTFAIRRLGDAPVVITIAWRTDALDRMPPGLLARAEATAGRVTLGPLDRAAIAELAERAYGRPLSAGAGERLHAHTGGNPLHTLALLDELPFAVAAGRAALPAPRSYATFVTALLAECSPEARRVAGALAIMGRAVPERVVGAAAGVAAPGLAADELAAAGLVVVTTERPEPAVGVAAESPRSLSFAHAMVRASIRDDLSPSELADLHRCVASVTSGDERLRHLLAAAHGPDAALAAAASQRADRLAAQGDPGAASRLRLAAAPVATAPAREELVLGAALELIQAGEPLGALTGEIDQLADSARRSLVLGREALMGGRRDEARAWLERAWGQSSADPGLASIAAPIADMLALAALDSGDWVGTRDWAERAVARSSSSGISATLLAHGLVMTRQAPEAERRMSALVDDRADQPLRAIDARVGRGVARLWANDLDGAVDDLRAAAAHLGRQGSLVAQAEVDAHLAEVALRAGRWAEALDLASSATAVVDDADAVWLGALAHGVLAFVLAARGDVAAADRHAALAAGSARVTGLMAAGLWAHHAALRSAVAAGDHAEVVRLGDRMAHQPWGEVPEGVHHWRRRHGRRPGGSRAPRRRHLGRRRPRPRSTEQRRPCRRRRCGPGPRHGGRSSPRRRRRDGRLRRGTGPRPRPQPPLRAGAPRDGRWCAPAAHRPAPGGGRPAGGGGRAPARPRGDPVGRALPARDRRLRPPPAPAPRPGRRAHGPRGARGRRGGPRPVQPRGGRRAGHQREDRRAPPRPDLYQARPCGRAPSSPSTLWPPSMPVEASRRWRRDLRSGRAGGRAGSARRRRRPGCGGRAHGGAGHRRARCRQVAPGGVSRPTRRGHGRRHRLRPGGGNPRLRRDRAARPGGPAAR